MFLCWVNCDGGENTAAPPTLLFSSKCLSSVHSRWLMLPEMPKFPSLSSSNSSASTLKPVPPFPAGARTPSWPPAARAWWMCPSGAEETETTGPLTERGGGGRGNRPLMKARSLEISKSQTLERITRGNRWVWAILPGEDRLHAIKAKKQFNHLIFIVVCEVGHRVGCRMKFHTLLSFFNCIILFHKCFKLKYYV